MFPVSPARAALIAAVLSTGMVYIDQTAVNIALPAIQHSLDLEVPDLQWVLSIYLLFLCAPLLLFGLLADRVGRDRIFFCGVVTFGASSVACGLAETLDTLLVARAIQGLGAAQMVAVGLALLTSNTPADQRGRMIGIWVSLTSVIIALGPVIGGLLVDLVSWRLVFFINLPLTVLGILVVQWWVPRHTPDSSISLDWTAAWLLLFGLGGLVFGLIEAGRQPWDSPTVLVPAGLGTLVLLVLVVQQYCSKTPLLPAGLWRFREFRLINLLTLWQWIGLSGLFLLLPLNLQHVQGFSAMQTGFALLPVSLMVWLTSRRAGNLADQHGPRLPMLGGIACLTLAFMWLSFVGRIDNYLWQVTPPLLMFGGGLALLATPLTSVAMSSLPDRYASLASGVNNFAARIANLLSIALLGTLLVNVFSSRLEQSLEQLSLAQESRDIILGQVHSLGQIVVPDQLGHELVSRIESTIHQAFHQGFQMVFWVCAVISLLSFVVVLLNLQSTPSRDP